MKRSSIFAVSFVFCFAVAVLGAQAPSQPASTLPGAKGILPDVQIQHVDRTVLREDIVHYRFDVVVGSGEFDQIRLHRIVREKQPWRPIRTATGVLLLPGAPNSFEMIFLQPVFSNATPWDHSAAIFLAKNDIDVWGMDYGWALVPPERTDFSFMNGWGLQRDIEHTQKALFLARIVRRLTGQGFGRLHLLGFSYGLYIGYSLAGEETQLPPGQRHLKGFIAVDSDFKDENESLRAYNCGAAASYQALLDEGVYQSEDGLFLKQVADLAESDANGESPFFPPLTNFQFALFAGAADDFGHFVGAYFDESGIPTGLRFTQDSLWVDVLQAVPPYMPVQVFRDTCSVPCNEIDVPFDDHLGEITLPILHVGAAGGGGEDGYYTTTLTASTDITKFTVQLLPDDERMFDFGHADLFTAENAETLVWQPILDWLVRHK